MFGPLRACAGLATTTMWVKDLLDGERWGGKLRCRKLEGGEMLNERIVCLFKMIMGEQESRLKATRQADSSPCFLM